MYSMQINTETEYREAVATALDAAKAYYQDGTLLLADAEYDTLIRSIREHEERHPEHRIEHGLHESVAAGVATGGEVRHSEPMLSLENSFTADDLRSWLESRNAAAWTTEPKYDGLSLSATYTGGKLIRIATRGDGATGEDVTYAHNRIQGLPATLREPVDIEVRGEVIFTHVDYETANTNRVASGKKAFVNPRNAAAGTLRAETLGYEAYLTFFAHGHVGVHADSHSKALAAVRDLGINTGEDGLAVVVHHDIESVLAHVERFGGTRENLPLDVDGCVIKVDDLGQQQNLGSSSRAPRWGIAYKYPALEATSVLREVEWTVGRTGRITPRAKIDPVFVAGTTVQYATLHNADDIARKDLMIGDVVLVKRAGEVIPRIEGSLAERRDGTQTPISAPSICPRCSGPIDTTEKIWRCTKGRNCGTVESLTYAASRDALDIEGLGEFLAQELVTIGKVETIADIFKLTEGDLIGIRYARPHTIANPATGEERIVEPRMGETSAQALLEEIAKARTQPLSKVFCALGVRMTGRSMSRRIAKRFLTMDAILAADAETLSKVEGIGPERAATILEELTDLKETIAELAALGVNMTEPVSETPGNEAGGVAGLTFVVTGSMTGPLAGMNRDEVHALIENAGGKTSSSVSKKTNYLVTGEAAGSKLEKARSIGVQVITPEALASLLGR